VKRKKLKLDTEIRTLKLRQ